MSKEKYFSVAWRLTILVLPWQTRWFRDASLGGWPWEQGRWSVYALMLLIILTIILGRFLPLAKGETKRGSARSVGTLLFLFIALSLLTTLSRVATAEWWIEVLLLAAFVQTLRARGVKGGQVAAWFALSLIPHVVLAVWQYFTGNVFGSKWLGIAAHLSEQLGVAVVEHDDVRILRAYGGFPHPNILGGWMAIGLIAVLQLASWAKTKWRALLWSLCAGLFSATLVISYSRSAWLAALLGMGIWCGATFISQKRQPDEEFSGQFAAIVLLSVAVFGGAVGYSQRAHILARTDMTQRVEAKSLSTRTQSLADGWREFLAHPVVGTGPNAELVAIAPSCGAKCPAPLEPPHDVFLLMLVDVGLVGIFLCASFLWFSRRFWTRDSAAITVAFFFLLLLDHYAWSTWSGVCLGAMVFLLQTRMPEGHSRA